MGVIDTAGTSISSRRTRLGELVVGDVVLAYFKREKSIRTKMLVRVCSCDPEKDFGCSAALSYKGKEIVFSEFGPKNSTMRLNAMTVADFDDRIDSIQIMERGVSDKRWQDVMEVRQFKGEGKKRGRKKRA